MPGSTGSTMSDLERELRDSREAIEDRLGQPCRLLAYPDGVSSPRVRRASARHFAAAFGTRLDYADRGQDIFDLARIDAYYLRTRQALDSLLIGRARSWLRWRRAIAHGPSPCRPGLLRGEDHGMTSGSDVDLTPAPVCPACHGPLLPAVEGALLVRTLPSDLSPGGGPARPPARFGPLPRPARRAREGRAAARGRVRAGLEPDAAGRRPTTR